MKGIVSSLILAILISVACWAKDGPFPIMNVLGEWKVEGVNMRVEISLSHYDDKKQPVLRVIARTAEADKFKRQLIGSGLVTSSLSLTDLVVDLKNERDQVTRLTITSDAVPTADGHEKSQFKMNISQGEKNIPTNLVKALNSD